jgi:multiple sugar transport system ATP-binding protein
MGQLIVNSLKKSFGKNLIVDDVSFTVQHGEFFVLLGPSGSGKSTLLRLICGLETPDTGEIIVDSRDITHLPPRERNLGMVFQDYGLYPNMNVYDNIAYGLEARGVNRTTINERVTQAAERLGLTEHLNNSVVDLSGGEQQRVALARALVKDADAYLYDEPLSNLDPKLRHKARRDILAVHREKQKPSIYVTHDQAEAFALGDRIAVLAGGKLQQVGTTEDLISQPASIFVAGFIGSPPVNLLTGSISREDNAYVFSGDGLTVPLPEKWNPVLNTLNGSEVVAGIRPDSLERSSAAAETANTRSMVTGLIESVEPLLGETIVIVKIGERTTIAAALQELWEGVRGDTVELAIDPDRIMLFDPRTEQSLLAQR